MAHTGDISGNFHAVGQTDASDLAQSGVRFLRGGGGYFNADTLFERSALGVNIFCGAVNLSWYAEPKKIGAVA